MTLALQYLRWVWVGVALAALVAVGSLLGAPAVLLALAGMALCAGIFALWGSLLVLTREAKPTLEDALAFVSASAEDERKHAVLRALKDLDYERAVGKLSLEDFDELRAHYRAEGRALLKETAAGSPSLERAEQALSDRLGLAITEPPVSLRGACASCQTQNDSDAQFCKKCGTRLAGQDEAQQ